MAKKTGRLAQLVGMLWGLMVSGTMFGCAGSEVTAAIVGKRLHSSDFDAFFLGSVAPEKPSGWDLHRGSRVNEGVIKGRK